MLSTIFSYIKFTCPYYFGQPGVLLYTELKNSFVESTSITRKTSLILSKISKTRSMKINKTIEIKYFDLAPMF